jgi:hypothetical protein
MAPTNRDIETADRLARIETKLDDFINLHNGGCAEVQVNRNWIRGISCIMVLSVGLLCTAFYRMSDKIDAIHDLLPYSPFVITP